MTYCPACNAAMDESSAFCGSCGARSGSAGGVRAAVVQAPGSGTLSPEIASPLAYILGFITGILFLVIEPYKNHPLIRFHAFQSIFFSAALFAFWIIWSIATSVLSFATLGVLGVAMAGVGLLIALGTLAYWLFLMYKAYKCERYKIPYLGELAAKQAGLA